jgi:hypothetical protein
VSSLLSINALSTWVAHYRYRGSLNEILFDFLGPPMIESDGSKERAFKIST